MDRFKCFYPPHFLSRLETVVSNMVKLHARPQNLRWLLKGGSKGWGEGGQVPSPFWGFKSSRYDAFCTPLQIGMFPFTWLQPCIFSLSLPPSHTASCITTIQMRWELESLGKSLKSSLCVCLVIINLGLWILLTMWQQKCNLRCCSQSCILSLASWKAFTILMAYLYTVHLFRNGLRVSSKINGKGPFLPIIPLVYDSHTPQVRWTEATVQQEHRQMMLD